jgi:hypothetical protein
MYLDLGQFTLAYPEPDQSSPYRPILSLPNPFNYYQPIYILVFLAIYFLLTN